MNYRFDIHKWLLLQLPLVLRKQRIYALIRCIAVGLNQVYEAFKNYSNDVVRRLENTSQVISLEKWLNDIFYLDGDIIIRDYISDNVYLHYQDEVPEEVYLGFPDEQTVVYLPSTSPSKLSGGFVILIPAELATEDNLKTIRKWVEYYRMAGTEYRIEIYE